MENWQDISRSEKKIKMRKWILAGLGLAAALLAVLVTLTLMHNRKIRKLAAEPFTTFTHMDTLDQRGELEKDAPWKNPALLVLSHEDLTEDQRNAVYYLCEDYFPAGASLDVCLYYMYMNDISEEDTRLAIDLCQVDFKAQALRRAYTVLAVDAYGPAKLAEQLDKDGFTPEERNYAIKNCGADWDAQAELEARKTLYYVGISRKLLVGMLADDGYDPMVVEEVIRKLDPDWNREALQQAIELRETSDRHLFPEHLYQKLLDWGFTEGQSRYAVDLLGI